MTYGPDNPLEESHRVCGLRENLMSGSNGEGNGPVGTAPVLHSAILSSGGVALSKIAMVADLYMQVLTH